MKIAMYVDKTYNIHSRGPIKACDPGCVSIRVSLTDSSTVDCIQTHRASIAGCSTLHQHPRIQPLAFSSNRQEQS